MVLTLNINDFFVGGGGGGRGQRLCAFVGGSLELLFPQKLGLRGLLLGGRGLAPVASGRVLSGENT